MPCGIVGGEPLDKPMRSIKTLLLLLSLLVAASTTFSADLAAQGPRLKHPERTERTTAPDENGLHQWTEWKGQKCPLCKGVGKSKCVTCERFGKDAESCPECQRKDKDKFLTTCRICIGEGTIPDPLKVVPCAGCVGAGMWVCTVCSGGGRLKVGAAKRWSGCPACRGKGGFPCTGCDGKRAMGPLQTKPPLDEAPPEKIQKTIKSIDATIEKFAAFEPIGGTKARKAVKSLTSAFDSFKKVNPAFKDLSKQAKSYMGKIFAGANFQGHEENEANTLKMIKENAEYYLKHQKRMLQLALKRAELNAAKAGK
tara:strand:- start:16612 stop:17544 length:933 start_codon:yes stop_codon:yes gene_type:complete